MDIELSLECWHGIGIMIRELAIVSAFFFHSFFTTNDQRGNFWAQKFNRKSPIC